MPFPAFTYVDESGQVQRFSQCPKFRVERGADYWISLYSHYRNGHLYAPGGIADQPAKFLEAMGLIDAELNKTDDDGNEKRQD